MMLIFELIGATNTDLPMLYDPVTIGYGQQYMQGFEMRKNPDNDFGDEIRKKRNAKECRFKEKNLYNINNDLTNAPPLTNYDERDSEFVLF